MDKDGHGKQMMSHSYSTRPNSKRISPCEDDGSGSHSDEPPCKRQTGQGSKQAVKAVEITHDDATPDSDPIDSHTVDEYTSPEIALQNDLVLETLFRYMNRSDLLSCRVVNKQWQFEATKELRRRKLAIRFSFRYQGNKMSRSTVYQDICRSLSKCTTPSLLSSFHIKMDSGIHLGSAGPTSIFTTVGKHLQNVTLHFNWSSRKCSLGISPLMTHLQNLLFCQAPNLEFLKIKFGSPDRMTYELRALDSSDHFQSCKNGFRLLPNLKTFIVSGTAPPNFCAHVINSAVNLRCLGGGWATSSFIKWVTPGYTDGGHLKTLGGFSSTSIKYFQEADGRDKIHLVKSFRVYLADDSDVQSDELDIELMEKFLTEHKQNLQLETFECVSKFSHGDASMAPRIVGVVNQILECSAGSLQKVRIEPAKWFKDLLIVPRLPNLQEICFDCFWSTCYGIRNGRFFPRGFNMNNNFPNVTSIVLLRCAAFLFRQFVSRMEIEMTEPVPSIRYITYIAWEKNYNIVPPPATVADFRHVFPNLVSVSYVGRNYYYKI